MAQSSLKTDSLFYFLFQTAPGILFELLGQAPEKGDLYEFKSIEIKQTAFRIDGVLVPSPEADDQTVYFVEVQFQDDPYFYQRFFAEIFLYLRQNPMVVRWHAAVTIMVYKFPSLSREEIDQMFGLSELKQTRVYQEAREEGIQEGRQKGIQEGRQKGEQEAARSLILKLLGYRVGMISQEMSERIQRLSIPQVELLGLVLLDFSSGADLEDWMRSQNID